MPNFFSRLFGSNKQKKNSNTSSKSIKKSKTEPKLSITPSPSPSTILPQSHQTESPSSSLPPQLPMNSENQVENQDLTYHLFSDTNDSNEKTNVKSFLSTPENNINDFSNEVNNYYFNQQQDEYSTISSATTSTTSFEDALFSHLSNNSDTHSNITQYSDIPKLVISTTSNSQGQSSFTVSFENETLNKLTSYSTQYNDIEKHFLETYTNALQCLSQSNQYNPAHAFRLFEYIASEGQRQYSQLSERTQFLVSFAQYRTGYLLCKSHCQDDVNQRLGYKYLQESADNGNPRAIMFLGHYAEFNNDLDRAADLFSQAASLGFVPAKVAYGILVLFKSQNHFELNTATAIDMLNEASNQGHSIASLALALYYEKKRQILPAVTFGLKFEASPNFPVYCVGYHQVGVILLKAGQRYSKTAIEYLEKAANANYLNDGKITKYTPSLRILGTLYYLGIGTDSNPSTAFNYILEAARLGDEPANIILGQFYQTQVGCAADPYKAMQIYDNYPHNIAAKLSSGLLLMEKNPPKAYRDFVDVVNFRPTRFDEAHWNIQYIKNKARVRIAMLQYRGNGTEENQEAAFRTLKELSDDFNFGEAHYWVGTAYLEGVKRKDGTTLVHKEQNNSAFAYFLKGAHQNESICQHAVGKMLRDGFSTREYTAADAIRFFIEAAHNNYLPSITMVGIYYFTGYQGMVARDIKKAFHYFSAAAKRNDPDAIKYLADYIINNNANGEIDMHKVYTQLSHSAGVEKDPTSYRMLALVVNAIINPTETYENATEERYGELHQIYRIAKEESIRLNQDIKFRFALNCLWKTIELNDHSSGEYLNKFCSKMTSNDRKKTIELFEKVETGVPNKMSMAFAHFLVASKNRSNALKKFIEIAKINNIATKIGRNACLEAAKLVLFDNQGKATNKVTIFNWLSEMVNFLNEKYLFVPYILLGKCHENEICSGCNKEMAATFYQKGLQYKLDDKSIEVFARMRLVEIFYNKRMDDKLKVQLDAVKVILDSGVDFSEKNTRSADLYYYQGILLLHKKNVLNYQDRAIWFLTKAHELGNIMATLELGYLYGTIKDKEKEAEMCFHSVHESSQTKINFKNRLTEYTVSRRDKDNFNKEVINMQIAAGVTYSYFNMERQAIDWFNEIPDQTFSEIMLLYYKTKAIQNRTPQRISRLRGLVDSIKTQSHDSYGCTVLGCGLLRLGQCYESGHGVSIDINKAWESYKMANDIVQNNEIYERLAEISSKVEPEISLFSSLCNAARNDYNAMFKLAQYYHKKTGLDKIPCSKAAGHYYNAAQSRHPQACYYYAIYKIDQVSKATSVNAAAKSKKAATYLQIAADQNHGPSYYELGKLKMETGLYEDGVDDLNESSSLNHGPASYRLGELYETGFTGIIPNMVDYRIQPNHKKAFELYQQAHDQGYMPALIKLGEFYERGLISEQDLTKAKECYIRALKSKKCPEGSAEYALGCFEETIIHSVSLSEKQQTHHYKTAFEWFQKALDAGSKIAKFKIGSYLVNGYVVVKTRQQDIQEGIRILLEEKENVNILAIKELARYYQSIRNDEQAYTYWKNASMLDDPEAYEILAQCYEKGLLGQHINPTKAAECKEKATEARKKAMEIQHSTMGFESGLSEDRK